MKIAFLHYHLKRGGVTTVIGHQVKALVSMGWQVMVLSGAPAEEPLPAPVVTVPEIGYDNTLHNSSYSPDKIAKKIIGAIKNHWPHGADVIHVHNPTLAKNRYLQAVLRRLQGSDMRLLCQIHDFAEDGRPAVFQQAPYLENCHYAAINPRDHQLLIQSGLKSNGCHLLANTIHSTTPDLGHPGKSELVIYPVRAIRRKNIGEALLISLFFHHGQSLAISLPPNSPADYASYDQWRSFARRYDLPVQFEIGVDLDYSKVLAQCRYVLNTSITEGFGFVYLEPWVHGKALWGRLLPDICQGFVDHGIALKHLYTQLRVPLQWIDPHLFEVRWKNTLTEASGILCCPLSHQEVDSAWHSVSGNDNIDFGLLDESAQQKVILNVITDRQAADRLRELNPFLTRPGPPENFEAVISRNAQVIAQSYHPDRYARRLKELYTAVVDTQVEQAINKTKLASAFLNPSDFTLLKWGAL
jgi:glycosyltransferase involved in cell wall biosynthesis